MPLGKSTPLEMVVSRIENATSVDKVVVATSTQPDDDELVKFCGEHGISTVRGSESNVYSRFLEAIRIYSPENILRITSDCPFVDPNLIDRLWKIFEKTDLEYASIATGAGFAQSSQNRFPDGFDAEWVRAPVLKSIENDITEARDLEHVTSFIWSSPEKFKLGHLFADSDYGLMRVTLDRESDLEFLRRLASVLGKRLPTVGYQEIIQAIQEHLRSEQDSLFPETYNEFYG